MPKRQAEYVVLEAAPGNLLNQGHICLGNEGVTDVHWQANVINNSTRRRQAAAIIRGEEPPTMDFAGILEREVQYVGQFCGGAKIAYPGDGLIEQTLSKSVEAWGLGDHLRFVPAGVGLPQLYCFLRDFNQKQEAAGLPTLKIYEQGDHTPGKEWWRNADVHESTTAGVSYLDHGMVMKATDLIGRPFNLPYDPQHAWTIEQGGSDFTSAEGTLYHFSRSILEDGRPLWGGGSVRCRNAYGLAYSLFVFWSAVDGLSVDYWHRTASVWLLGALPWRFIGA